VPFAVWPCRLQPERAPLWETSGYHLSGCGGIDTSRWTWCLFTWPLMISTPEAPQISRIRSRTHPNRTRQNRIAVVRHPHQIQVNLEYAVVPMPVLRHEAHHTIEPR
jgi:hypothetical protein